jgi:hypothetical protein
MNVQSASTGQGRNGLGNYAKKSELRHSSTVSSSPASSAEDTLSDFDRRRLNVLESILSARSFAAKTKIWCDDEIGRFNNVSHLQKLEDEYQALLRSEPATREDEEKRQTKLEMYRQVIGDITIAVEKNLNDCQGAVVSGFTKMPTDQQIQEEITLIETGVLPPNHR